jgi:hypothetical protein
MTNEQLIDYIIENDEKHLFFCDLYPIVIKVKFYERQRKTKSHLRLAISELDNEVIFYTYYHGNKPVLAFINEEASITVNKFFESFKIPVIHENQ